MQSDAIANYTAALSHTISDVGRGRHSGAMGAAVKASTHLNAVPDHLAMAMLADRGHSLDGTLEAVECMARSESYYFECFVVIVTAHFTLRHRIPPERLFGRDDLQK